MEPALEFLPAVGRSRRYRKWPDEVKARVVAEALMPGVRKPDLPRRSWSAATLLLPRQCACASGSGRRVDWRAVLKERLAGEVPVIRVLDPPGDDRLIRLSCCTKGSIHPCPVKRGQD